MEKDISAKDKLKSSKESTQKKLRPSKKFSKSGSAFDIPIEVHRPIWNKRIHLIAREQDYWRVFHVGSRKFIRTFQGVSEVVTMKTSEYYREKDNFQWSMPKDWERIV